MINKPLQNHFLAADGDIHIATGPGRPDPMAWAESIRTVATEDREWLRQHPEALCRRRLITPVEQKAFGYRLPPDTQVVVKRGPDGSQIRLIGRQPG